MDALKPRFREITDSHPGVEALLDAHHADMRAQSPEESCHVMTGDALRAEGARVFALSEADGQILAIGALKSLPAGAEPAALAGKGTIVELKSMHVARSERGRGLGRILLSEMLQAARQGGAEGACLETGTEAGFAAARAMYISQGFVECPPFGAYRYDPLSVFMCRSL